MSDQVQVKIIGAFDLNTTEQKLKAQLKQIEKKLTVQIGVDAKQISQIHKQIQQMQSQITKQSKGIKVIDDKDALKNINQISKGTKELWTSLNKAVKEYKKLGEVKINKSFDPATKELQGFNLQLKRADGTLESLKFKMANLQTPKGLSTAFELDRRSVVDNSDKIKEQQLQAEHATRRKISAEQEKQKQKTEAENKKIAEQTKQLEHQLRMYKERARIQAQNLTRRYGDSVDSTQISRYLKEVNSLTTNTPKARQRMDELEMSFRRMGSSVRSSSSHVVGFGEQLGIAMQRFPIWMIASTAFYQSLNILTSFYDTLTLIDQKLISIQKVTNSTDMSGMLERATDSAKEFGRTIDQSLASIEEITKLGFSDTDAEALSKNALLLATVGEMGDADAANYIVAIMRQYKLEVADTIDVVNSLNELSNTTGSTTTALAQALSKSSSSAQVAGMSFNELAGIASQVIETLKIGGNEAGTFLKALNTRILRTGTQKDLESFGIQVKDTNGELLSSTEILKNVAAQWDNFDKTAKSSIGESLGGAWHVNKVIATIEGMDRAMYNAQTSANSYGSAVKELETYQEGLAFKSANLKASLQELAMTAAGSGGRSGLVILIESLTALVQGFNRLTEATDGWNIKLPLLAAGVFGITKALQALSLAAKGAQLSFGWIGLGVVAVQGLVSAMSGATIANEVNTDSLVENAKQTAVNANTLKSLYEQYNSLKDEAGLNAEKHKELQGVLEKIREIAPQLVKHNKDYTLSLDANATKVAEYSENLRTLSKEQLKQAQLANSINVSNTNSELDELNRQIQEFENTNMKTFDIVLEYEATFDVGSTVEAKKQLDEKVKQLQDDYNKAIQNKASQETLQKINDEIAILTQGYAKYFEAKTKAQSEYGEYAKMVDERNQLIAEKEMYKQQETALNGLVDDTDSLSQSNERLAGNMDAAKTSATGAGQAFDETGEIIDDAATDTDRFAKAISEAKDDFSALSSIIVEMSKAGRVNDATLTAQVEGYKALADEVSPLNELLEKVAEGKGLSASEAMELVSQEKELANAISVENGVIKVNEKAVKSLRDTKVKSYTDMLESIKTEAILTANKTLQNLKNYGIEISAIQNLADAKKKLAQAESGNDDFYNNLGKGVTTGTYNSGVGVLTSVTEQLENIEKLQELASAGLSEVGTEAAKTAKAYENSVYVSNEFKKALEAVTFEIEKQQALRSKELNHSKKYETALRKEIALQNEKKKLLQDQAKALETQIAQGKIQQTGIVNTSSSSYSPSSTTGGGNSSQIWNFFKSKGFTDNIVAGIMGNLQLESGLNSNALNKSSGAFGIAQWLGGRKTGLQNYAKAVGSSVNDLNTQLEFLWSELNSTEKKTLNYLNNNRGASASSIAAAFDKLFERSEGTHIPQRQQYANQFLSQFSGTAGSVSETQSKASKEAAQGLQEVDQARSELLQLKQDLMAVEAEIEKANLELLKLPIAVYEKRIADQDKNIKNTTNSLYNLTEGTSEYGFKLRQLIAYHQERQVQNEKEIQYMRQLIGSGKLSAVQIAELSGELQTLLDRRYEIAQSRDEINSQIVGNSLYTYASAIEEVNSKLEMSQALQQSFAEGSEAFNHETEQQNTLLQEKKAILTQQIAKLTELIGKQNLSKEATKEFTDQLKQLKLELVNTNNALFSTRSEVADNAINTIRKSYEMQREYETKLKDQQIKDLEEVHDLRMKQYDEDLSRYEEIINEKIRLIDDQDDEDIWNKDLSEMQKQQLDLQSKISVLARSSSISDYARRIELEEQLAALTEQIEEKKNDRSKELLKRGLTDQLDSFKKEIDRKKKAEDEQFNATKSRLERERDEIERHYNEILNDETYFASLRQNIINGNVEETKKKIKEFLEEFKKMNKDIIKELGLSWTELQSMINNATGSLGGLDGVGNSGSSSSTQKKSDWHTYLNNKRLAETGNPTPERAAQLRAANDALRKKWGFPDGSYDYLKNNPPKFHKGGIVNGSGNKLVNLANILFNKKPNEQHILALREELFSPKENIINKFIPNLREVVGSGNGGGNVYHLSPTIQVTVSGDDKNIGKSIAEQTFEAMGEILRDWGK